MKYKNISKTTQVLIGVGTVEPGDVISVDEPLENQNFEKVVQKKKSKKEDSKKSE